MPCESVLDRSPIRFCLWSKLSIDRLVDLVLNITNEVRIDNVIASGYKRLAVR
jgi:hypothetical protein